MAANPFITQANPMGQVMVDPEAQALQRQKQYAAMLLQSNQQPQGQMIGSHYVAPSWTQQLNAAISPVVGAYMMNKADAEQKVLAEKLRERNAADIQDALQTMKGSPEQTTYGAGAEGPTKTVTPAVAGNREAAIAKLLKSESPMAGAIVGKLIEQQFKEPKWEKAELTDPKTGNTRQGWVDVNSLNPEATFRQGGEKPAISPVDVMKGKFEGWYTGGTGGVGGGASMATGGVGGGGSSLPQVAKGDEKYLPKDIPQYVYDPNITPKANLENAAKFSAENQNNVKNAKNSFSVIKTAADILNSNAPSSGRGENIITGAREFFGGGGEASKADAQLKVLGTKLTMQQPRFEGPQSDKDTAMYQAAAGDIGNPNIPIATRIASLQTMIDLSKKYYPNGDWDSVDLTGPVIKKNFLGGTVGLGAKALSSEDKQALNWANQNPKDPRSAEIKKRLGM